MNKSERERQVPYDITYMWNLNRERQVPYDITYMWNLNRERQVPYDITYMWNLSMARMNLCTEKQTRRHREQTCGCQGGGEGVDELGVGVICKLLHLEWISNEVLLYSQGIISILLRYNMMEGNMRKRMYVYFLPGSLCCSAEIDTTL